jgi:hypothetical protein
MFAFSWGIRPPRSAQAAGLLLALYLWPGWARARDTKAEAEKREPAATSLSTKGMLLRRETPKSSWQVVDEKETLNSGDLLIGVSGTSLQSKNGAVGLKLRVDFDSPLPILEPAVVLHPAGEFDLDFTLDRGRVDVSNLKQSGSARVRMRAWGKTWEITLVAPGSSLAVELLGRWRPGTRFSPKPEAKDVPVAQMLFLVLAGEVYLKHEGTQQILTAPPGPAMIGWNNFTGMDSSRQRLEKLPEWATPASDAAAKPEVKKRLEIRERLIHGFATKSTGEVIDELLSSNDPAYRRIGVVVAGALDDLPRLGKQLTDPKHPDVWDNTVVVLRHWLGRAPGQDQLAYRGLMEKHGMTPIQAETVIEFLHGFSEEDLAQPETYEMLIDFLGDDKLFVRGLAYWHLRRQVPAGAKIPYDPLGPKAERDKARQEWKKLVPPGKLPPNPE